MSMTKPYFLVLLLFAFSGKAQQSVEVFDLLNALIPDSAMMNNAVDWKTTETVRNGVKWNKGSIARINTGKSFYKNGIAHIYFNNQSAPCGSAGSCTWKASLEGPGKGYTKIKFSTQRPVGTTESITIKQVFGRRNYRSKLMSKCPGGKTFIYEVKVPGKKMYWLKLYEVSAGSDAGIIIEAWLDKTNMPVNCQ
jgi:hypothetical protein